jgi:hypothetical protein
MKARTTRVAAATAIAPLAVVPAPPVSADSDTPCSMLCNLKENHGVARIIGDDADGPFVDELARRAIVVRASFA